VEEKVKMKRYVMRKRARKEGEGRRAIGEKGDESDEEAIGRGWRGERGWGKEISLQSRS